MGLEHSIHKYPRAPFCPISLLQTLEKKEEQVSSDEEEGEEKKKQDEEEAEGEEEYDEEEFEEVTSRGWNIYIYTVYIPNSYSRGNMMKEYNIHIMKTTIRALFNHFKTKKPQ